MKIGQRLALAFSLVLLIVATSAAIGVWRLDETSDAMESLATVGKERQELAIRWRQTIDLNWVRTEAALLEDDPARITKLQAEMDKTSQVTASARERIHQLVQTDIGKQLLREIDERREGYRTPRAALLKRRLAGEDISGELEKTLRPLANAYSGSIQKFEERQQLLYETALSNAKSLANNGELVLSVSGVVAVLLGAVFAWTISRSITVPLGNAAVLARRIADGDLTNAVDADGKMRQLN